MNERQKIILIVSLLLAVIGLVIVIFLPSKSETRTLDFYIQDANGNNHLEVNEKLRFLVNDSSEVSDKTVLWKMGNGDSIVGHPNINYKYRKAGKYLVTLHIDGRYITGRYIQIDSIKEKVAVDSIPHIHGVSEGYQGEDLVFSADGYGVDTWLWEFGESGTVDAFERQVVYKYDHPGKYIIKLKTNTTTQPVEHEITILPKVEDIMDQVQVDSVALAENDIKRHLQAIAGAKVSDKSAYYANMNYIKNTYFRYDASQIIVEVNSSKYSVFPDYCQGLHFLASNEYKRVMIESVKIDDLKNITKLQVTQRYIGK